MKPNPTVLIIDDERAIRRLLCAALEPHYQVCEAENGQLGLQEAAAKRPDVIILDLGLPDMDGVTVLKRLREWSQTPVLVLSVRDREADKVAALDNGADDYLTKPFGTAELLARLRVIQRRAPGGVEEPVHVIGPLQVDLAAHQVKVHGREVSLTATEFALLRVLVQHAGKVVTHKLLLRTVWGPNAEEQSQYLRVYFTHLRKKLETEATGKLIQNEPGIGYRLLAAD
ncbi:MAG: response regulator [Verrucomicrobiia bacterium]|jgi:two-component system KDP operon response regulator KdpE